ncbi:MAG: FHA domain-containing protein, partial [Planctomycetes bacterium]|nr:FHA domain-containing protein [Planctomycetota bacterium]
MPRILVLEGAHRGALFDLRAGETRLGRDPESDIPLLDDKASRRHAVIAPAPAPSAGGWTLRDLDSKNGTALNGLPLAATAAADLAHGDRVRIGATLLLFVDDAAAAAVPVPGAAARHTTLAATRPGAPAPPPAPTALVATA